MQSIVVLRKVDSVYPSLHRGMWDGVTVHASTGTPSSYVFERAPLTTYTHRESIDRRRGCLRLVGSYDLNPEAVPIQTYRRCVPDGTIGWQEPEVPHHLLNPYLLRVSSVDDLHYIAGCTYRRVR